MDININSFPSICLRLRRSYSAICVCCGGRGLAVDNVHRQGSLCGKCNRRLTAKVATRTIYSAYKKHKRRREIAIICLVAKRCVPHVRSNFIAREVASYI